MSFFIVFGASTEDSLRRGDGSSRDKRLVWWPNPVGVFNAPTPELACHKAASKTGRLATFAAVECTPWGVSLLEVEDTYELGDVMDESEAQINDTKRRLAALEKENDKAMAKVTRELDDLEKQ